MAVKPVPAAARSVRAFFAVAVCIAIFLSMTSPAAAQKEKKKKKDSVSADSHTIIPMPDEQRIDYEISQLLGAWQVGDIDRLHQVYADDAVFVSGLWAPPVFGWSNYLPLYQQQRARMQLVPRAFLNPFVRGGGGGGGPFYGGFGGAPGGGEPMFSGGKTSLVLEKRTARWLVVHTHPPGPRPPPPQPQQPAPPANT